MTEQPVWAIMPILAHPEYTRAAIADVLAQTVPIRLLLINQGVDDAFREELERIAEAHDDRVLLWSHQPPLPSLAATWNRALDFVWACGGDRAWVINNDVRLLPCALAFLSAVLDDQAAFFVSGVGVTERDFEEHAGSDWAKWQPTDFVSQGGPDFSCFLISRLGHETFRFDEAFIPAYCEDIDYHRRLLLAGEGHRIFSINLPYLHYGSATLKTVEPGQRAAIDRAITAGSRAHYQRKWGGPVNGELFTRPFDDTSTQPDGTATTPYLQAHPVRLD